MHNLTQAKKLVPSISFNCLGFWIAPPPLKFLNMPLNNGYPEAVINTVITKKINQFCRPTQLGRKKCPVCLHLPWLGNVSMRYQMQIKIAVKRRYFAVEPCIIYTTRQLLPAVKKDVLPTLHQSNIAYQFLCHFDSRYVGHISQRL